MIRVAAFALLIILLGVGIAAALRFLSRREIDWPGVAFTVGFVMLAFWLHQVTGAGLLFG